jgi:hypothetical protein
MLSDLLNKNIILISPRYFNYEKEIQHELEERGAFVHYIDDRIKNSTYNKAFFRLKLSENVGKRKVREYFEDHLARLAGKKIDYLIAIIPEGFAKEILEFYRAQLPDTFFILYMWDSIDNRPYIIETLDLYHKTFTFDKNNSDRYGLIFRPLFYTNEYKEIGLSKRYIADYKYHLSFIGTAHSDRYAVVHNLVASSARKLKTFFFFYLQSPIVIAYYRVVDRNFRKVKYKDISFQGLSKKEVLSIIEDSACIIDINHPKQTGLTIRTIEVLGAKRKLITTNKDVINYDFYDPQNILLIDRNMPVMNDDFLKTAYKEIDDDVYNKYSLSQWINDVLSIN